MTLKVGKFPVKRLILIQCCNIDGPIAYNCYHPLTMLWMTELYKRPPLAHCYDTSDDIYTGYSGELSKGGRGGLCQYQGTCPEPQSAVRGDSGRV